MKSVAAQHASCHSRRARGAGALTALCALVAALGSVSSVQAQTWRNATDGSAANASDISDCFIDARRVAQARYPPTPPAGLPGGSRYGDESDRRFEMEISLFDQCMRRKGFERMEQK
jgi:hypothetical protein